MVEITKKPVEVEIINESGSDVKLFSVDQAGHESEEGILHNEQSLRKPFTLEA